MILKKIVAVNSNKSTIRFRINYRDLASKIELGLSAFVEDSRIGTFFKEDLDWNGVMVMRSLGVPPRFGQILFNIIYQNFEEINGSAIIFMVSNGVLRCMGGVVDADSDQQCSGYFLRSEFIHDWGLTEREARRVIIDLDIVEWLLKRFGYCLLVRVRSNYKGLLSFMKPQQKVLLIDAHQKVLHCMNVSHLRQVNGEYLVDNMHRFVKWRKPRVETLQSAMRFYRSKYIKIYALSC